MECVKYFCIVGLSKPELVVKLCRKPKESRVVNTAFSVECSYSKMKNHGYNLKNVSTCDQTLTKKRAREGKRILEAS